MTCTFCGGTCLSDGKRAPDVSIAVTGRPFERKPYIRGLKPLRVRLAQRRWYAYLQQCGTPYPEDGSNAGLDELTEDDYDAGLGEQQWSDDEQ